LDDLLDLSNDVRPQVLLFIFLNRNWSSSAPLRLIAGPFHRR